jgi:hypothetical protein
MFYLVIATTDCGGTEKKENALKHFRSNTAAVCQVFERK